MRVEVNGARLYFDVEGAQLVPDGPILREKPTIVMLHGGPGSDHATFRPYMSFLADHAQVLYLDHRGHGRSDDTGPGGWNLRQWANDVVGFLDALDLERPMVLGASFGGFVAQAFATAHPDRVSRLALVSTAPRSDAALSAQMFARLGGPEAGAVARCFLAGNADVAEDYMRLCLPHYSVGELDLEGLGRSIDTPAVREHFFGREGEWHQVDFRPVLPRIACPTLVLHGALDPVLPQALAREMHAAIPNAQLHVVEQAGHGWGDQPDEWQRVLTGFLFGN